MGSQGGGFPRGRFGGGPGARPGRETGQPGDFSAPPGGGMGGAGGGQGGPIQAGGEGIQAQGQAGTEPGPQGPQQLGQDTQQGPPPGKRMQPYPLRNPGLQRPGNFGPGSFGGGQQTDQLQGGPGGFGPGKRRQPGDMGEWAERPMDQAQLQGGGLRDMLKNYQNTSHTMEDKGPWTRGGGQSIDSYISGPGAQAQQDQQGPAPQQAPQPFKPGGQNRFKQANNPFRQQQTRVSQAQQAGMPSKPVAMGETPGGRPAPPQGVGQPAQTMQGPEAEQQKKRLPQGGGAVSQAGEVG